MDILNPDQKLLILLPQPNAVYCSPFVALEEEKEEEECEEEGLAMAEIERNFSVSLQICTDNYNFKDYVLYVNCIHVACTWANQVGLEDVSVMGSEHPSSLWSVFLIQFLPQLLPVEVNLIVLGVR